MIGRAWLRSVIVVAGIAGGVPAGAAGGPIPSDPQARPLSEAELSEQRGGFSWGGLDIRLGVDLRSYAGDALVLRTVVNWNGAAEDVRRVTGVASAPAAGTDVRAGILSATGLDIDRMGASATIANDGQTAFIQRIDGTIQNIIVNRASHVDLRQQVDARLDIGGYAPFHDGLMAARIGAALSSMRIAAIGGRAN